MGLAVQVNMRFAQSRVGRRPQVEQTFVRGFEPADDLFDALPFRALGRGRSGEP
jgi:hypothetical protein